MNDLNPINQVRLFGLDKFFNELIQLYEDNKLPNKILLSGQKGIGKSTLAYHFINFVLSKEEEYNYNTNNFEINPNNHSFKTVSNKSNTNFFLIDINLERKSIDVNQIRDLISDLNKSSFNKKPRFVLIDNIELLNINAVNSLLKILEEPNFNVHFILINSNKKILPTLLSRCINFKISLSNYESLKIANELLSFKLSGCINKDLLNYYLSPGNIYNLVIFAQKYEHDLANLDLQNFLKIIINDKYYKKDNFIKFFIYELIEFYLNKISFSFSLNLSNQYSYFIKRISDIKKFNLDEESLFIEFEDQILNG